MTPAFRCVTYDCTLSVEACVGRVESASSNRSLYRSQPMLDASKCGKCVVGKEHRAGSLPTTWPDGSPLARLTLASSTRPVARPVDPSKTLRARAKAAEKARRYRARRRALELA